MNYLDRIIVDGRDRDAWSLARRSVIGASDAAHFSKLASVDKYLAAKLGHGSFHGNSYTESGHRWEPMMLAWAGIPQNLALIHSVPEPGFACTPDGLADIGTSGVLLAECKAKHNKVVTGPTLPEWRQLAWQFLCLPEAVSIEFLWAEIVNDEMRTAEPKHLTVLPSNPQIVAATRTILPIANDLLPRLRAALEFERSLAA